MTRKYDIAVIGSGFAGSVIAMIAKQLGHSVILIDKGTHPRVVIGESSTPLANLLLEDLATRYDLPLLRPLTKWGSWQREYPEIACGLKRGFTFYHHDRKRPTVSPPLRTAQLLVAASPNDELADTHWYRADFDRLLVFQAQTIGVDYSDQTAITSLSRNSDRIDMEGSRSGREVNISARFLIDASGPRGFLHRAFQLEELALPGISGTQAIYSHFSGVERLESLPWGKQGEQPPYPIDNAAVHHVFDGGWIWILNFNNGITSAGVAATDEIATELGFLDPKHAWERLLAAIPVLQVQFANATPTQPFTHIPRLSFRTAAISDPSWVMLPSASGFVDPLLSTGFTLALLGISRLADILEHNWDRASFPKYLKDYSTQTEKELLATAHLVAALYASMNDFPVFSALSLLYFAASSFSESARRLGRPQLARSFLLHDDPVFGPASLALFERSRLPRNSSESAALVKDILLTIEPFNVAGLGESNRQNWYPVEAADLIRSSSKLRATPEDIADMLQRCDFPLSSVVDKPLSLSP